MFLTHSPSPPQLPVFSPSSPTVDRALRTLRAVVDTMLVSLVLALVALSAGLFLGFLSAGLTFGAVCGSAESLTFLSQ